MQKLAFKIFGTCEPICLHRVTPSPLLPPRLLRRIPLLLSVDDVTNLRALKPSRRRNKCRVDTTLLVIVAQGTGRKARSFKFLQLLAVLERWF